MKLIKNSFIALMLLSYASMAISMEQPGPSLWQRFKWTFYNDDVEYEATPKQKLGWNLAGNLIANMPWVNAGLLGLYDMYSAANSNLPTIATIQDGLPKEQIELIRGVLLPMGVSASTKISIRSASPGYSMATARHNLLEICPDLFNLLTQEEQKGILAHEGSHLLNNDELKTHLITLFAPLISYGILKVYDLVSAQCIAYLGSKFPAYQNELQDFQINNHKFSKSWIPQLFLNPLILILFQRSCEWGADRQGAQAVGTSGLISFFNKFKDPKFIKKLVEIKVQPEAVGATEWILKASLGQWLVSSILNRMGINIHPSDAARIKALEALRK